MNGKTYPAARAGAGNGVAPCSGDLDALTESLYVTYVISLRSEKVARIYCAAAASANAIPINFWAGDGERGTNRG